jgi:hypothetical protein
MMRRLLFREHPVCWKPSIRIGFAVRDIDESIVFQEHAGRAGGTGATSRIADNDER